MDLGLFWSASCPLQSVVFTVVEIVGIHGAGAWQPLTGDQTHDTLLQQHTQFVQEISRSLHLMTQELMALTQATSQLLGR